MIAYRFCYVIRQSAETKYTYEERLQQSLKIDGYLAYIIGPSKTGKTVLLSMDAEISEIG